MVERGRKRLGFADRREEIVAVASELLNIHGASGLRLADVAIQLGLDISSLAHYFPKKDALVATCLERSIAWLEEVVSASAEEPEERSRANALIAAQFELFRRQRAGEPALAFLSDLPSLADEARLPLEHHLDRTVREIAEYFPASRPGRSRSEQLLASNILSSNIFWLPAWQDDYATHEFPRTCRNLVELFDQGFVEPAAFDCAEATTPPLFECEDDARARFLSAATRLINRLGHNGARVERIAAELGLSPGSFYHHLRTKNELVSACFERSFDIFERALDIQPPGLPKGSAILNVTRAVGTYQLTAAAPLLRIGSYQILPGELRQKMFRRSIQLTRRVAGIISDGIADGSVRMCDPYIASQYYLATVYGLSDLKEWSSPSDAPRLLDKLSNALVSGAI